MKAQTRQHILEVATVILERDGAAAVSTRSVATAAGIRTASLYQHFDNKDGLLEALAIHAFDKYLAEKQSLELSDDPIADMRLGWDTHVEFGLRHPALYLLMYGTERPGHRPPAAEEARNELLTFLHQAADAGRLRVPPDVAAHLLQAAVTGVTLTLIGDPDAAPDISERMRDTLVASLTTDQPEVPSTITDTGLAPRALALDAALDAADQAALPLRQNETALLRDWLRQLSC